MKEARLCDIEAGLLELVLLLDVLADHPANLICAIWIGRRDWPSQLSKYAVPVLDMLNLARIKVVEELVGLGCVLPQAGKVIDPQFLLRNMPFALRNMALGLL
ncbi:hypothetical protein [Bradyrhizobium zhanjiangense]|uniref:Uncharacterized protein n=1 Tax=Bradyrhizobium zhanjiangense TaxID=1325107 RepID=A0A4Q0RUH3_9BRAD|nr:hypothetical protein [Bradyrhizobium zhanjiangense]RXH23006.1 hypothetical protein XH94_37130 [Bradyrhizobium zhanjiangense]